MTGEVNIQLQLDKSQAVPPRPKPDAFLRQAVAEVCEEEFGTSLRAAVLTGSLARGEATFRRQDHCWRALSDADLIFIFHNQADLPPATKVQQVCRKIEDALKRHSFVCQVKSGAGHADYLRKMRADIFSFELRTCGCVVWGEPEILSLIPAFHWGDIPLEDAWRLLCNRIVEQLEVARGSGSRQFSVSIELQYPTIKLYLDMATSLLLFLSKYACTYRVREQLLSDLAKNVPYDADLPFALQDFARCVAWCTDWKLGTSWPTEEQWRQLQKSAVVHAHLLWRWELTRLTGGCAHQSDDELLTRWRRQQPLERRLRGWLHVMRKQGRHGCWRYWRRWASQAWKGSPRQWLYGAASKVWFRLPSLSEFPQVLDQEIECESIRRMLPVLTRSAHEASDWQQLAAEILWNYHEFVEDTRA